jgi:hypothetical protein
MPQNVVLPQFGAQETVGAIATEYPFTVGVDVTQTIETSDGFQAVELVKSGTFSIVSTATGVASDAVTFTNAFPAACDFVLLTLSGLGGAVINGGSYAPTADLSKTGFTASASITTVGTTNITGTWVAFGH